jgi:hypothetical protein
LENLPIAVDSQVVEVKLSEKNNTTNGSFLCFWGNPGKQYAFSDTLSVYDSGSEELGHGGAPYFGFAGVEIYNKDGVRLGVRLSWGDGGPSSPKGLSVLARGVKSLKLDNGEEVFVSSDVEVMSAGETRLVGLLSEYSKPASEELVESFLAPEEEPVIISARGVIEYAVARKFFSRTDILESPERERVNRLLEVLKAVTPK